MAKLVINANKKLSRIHKELQGQFSEHLGRCIYEGIYVGENSEIPNVNGMRTDVVEALKQIRVPVLRWPGGCFADEYHWKDGIGPKEKRKKIVNTHWGGVVEDNSFGTHEYFELCRQLGCETYVNGNMGSGTVQEMSEWVEYMTFEGVSPMADLRAENGHEKAWKVDFFGVGNENWGCGGNMNPEFYGNMYRRYQTYVRNYAGNQKIQKIACGANVDDYEWTQEVLKTCCRRNGDGQHGFMDGLSLHYYTHPGGWENKGSATEFDEKMWYQTMKKTLYMEELITRHGAIMDQFDPKKEIGMIVDEWGTWFDVEPGTNPGFLYQQNTMRDALVAGINLNIFNKHSDRVKMANIAQMVNVLQSVILTEGAKMIKTPTYHVFDMYKYHQDAELCDSTLETKEVGVEENNMVPNLTESVSVDANGVMHITMTNLDLENAYPIEAAILGMRPEQIMAEIVTGEMHEKNTFEDPDCVKVQSFDGVSKVHGGIAFTIPACSVLHIAVS
ncbi:MAG: alpha-L-arabinofuranosidase C-terminal domain-containing protein [Lachnospiraceae bacterium]|nr:alpha-L-arabinofuranosidase C-terminal domain-containing protein [Lachnospiraceae bacterium]